MQLLIWTERNCKMNKFGNHAPIWLIKATTRKNLNYGSAIRNQHKHSCDSTEARFTIKLWFHWWSFIFSYRNNISSAHENHAGLLEITICCYSKLKFNTWSTLRNIYQTNTFRCGAKAVSVEILRKILQTHITHSMEIIENTKRKALNITNLIIWSRKMNITMAIV